MKLVKEKPEWVLLGEEGQDRIESFVKKYKKDPIKARVFYFSNDKTNLFQKNRLILYIHKNGDYQVVNFRIKLFMTITNKLYERESKVESISFSKGKYYYLGGAMKGGIKSANLSDLNQLVSKYPRSLEAFLESVSKLSWHGWIKTLSESELTNSIPLDAIVKYKLFSEAKVLKHYFKLPEPVVRMYLSTLTRNFSGFTSGLKYWKSITPYLTNINKLNREILTSPLFSDTVSMAKSLNRRINCGWSAKRLKLEHDSWAKEITMSLIEMEDIRPLNIHERFLNFCEHTGYEPLKTNVDLMLEGKVQSHCVATYTSRVDYGTCCILHVKGYTLELRAANVNNETGAKLTIGQFKGFDNAEAPQELMNEMQLVIGDFNNVANELLLKRRSSKHTEYLPFTDEVMLEPEGELVFDAF